MYDYLFFDVEPGLSPYRRPAQILKPLLRDALGDTRGEVLGLFFPKIGWSTSQAAALLAWPGGDEGREAAIGQLMAAPGAKAVRRERLAATARPAKDAVPSAGGIFVHRWFVVEASEVDAFVTLSVQGWANFEASFDARIFGLLAAERTDEDLRDGVARLLLLTHYGSHAVWEASRDPTTEGMKTLMRRQVMTRATWAASTVLAES